MATIPGDGIGPEVVDATLPPVEGAATSHGFDLTFTRYDWGTERHLDEGSMLPDDGLDRL